MPIPNDFWLLFLVNLPLVSIVLLALQKGWIVMGITHNRIVAGKDIEIAFREQLRQEAIKDTEKLVEKDSEKTEALRELTSVVQETLKLNDRLLNEDLDEGWDGNDRRPAKDTSRTRRGA